MKRPTIRDVALAANVSVTTVSDALSGKGRISDATRERVAEVAKQLNFRASNTAKSLNAGRSGVLLLGIVRNEDYAAYGWDSEFFLQVLGGASDLAMSRGYVVAYLPFDPGSALPEVVCDGMIVIDPMQDDPLVTFAEHQHLPLITLGRIEGAPHSAYVDNDLSAVVGRAMQHLSERRGLAPLLIYYARPASYVHDVLSAYHQWCERAGLVARELALESELTIDETISRIAEYVQSQGGAVNGIVTAYDSLAIAAESALERLGIAVPAEVQLISVFDSTRLLARSVPISAIDLKPRTVGRELAENLILAVERSAEFRPRTLIPGSLVVRATSGGAASSEVPSEIPSGVPSGSESQHEK